VQGEPRGFCIVEYDTVGDATKAIRHMNGYNMRGRAMAVRYMLEKEGPPDAHTFIAQQQARGRGGGAAGRGPGGRGAGPAAGGASRPLKEGEHEALLEAKIRLLKHKITALKDDGGPR
jgi:RNA recognition motif-containing protein